MSLFIPDLMLNNLTELGFSDLKKRGIKGIVLDVDNTLTLHGSQEVLPIVLDWLASMKSQGMKLMLVSNNTRERVTPFAQRLGLDFVAMGCKPLPYGLKRAQRQMGLSADQIALVGDQIYTDILGGNAAGFWTILVEPFELESGAFFRLKRSLEQLHIRKYRKKNGGRL